jgi:hypothetical protein
MKTYWGSGGIAPPFLTSALDGGEWSFSRTGRFTPGERSPGTLWRGGWVSPRAGLDAVEKEKMLPIPGIEPRPSSPSLYRLSYPDSMVSDIRDVKFLYFITVYFYKFPLEEWVSLASFPYFKK